MERKGLPGTEASPCGLLRISGNTLRRMKLREFKAKTEGSGAIQPDRTVLQYMQLLTEPPPSRTHGATSRQTVRPHLRAPPPRPAARAAGSRSDTDPPCHPQPAVQENRAPRSLHTRSGTAPVPNDAADPNCPRPAGSGALHPAEMGVFENNDISCRNSLHTNHISVPPETFKTER